MTQLKWNTVQPNLPDTAGAIARAGEMFGKAASGLGSIMQDIHQDKVKKTSDNFLSQVMGAKSTQDIDALNESFKNQTISNQHLLNPVEAITALSQKKQDLGFKEVHSRLNEFIDPEGNQDQALIGEFIQTADPEIATNFQNTLNQVSGQRREQLQHDRARAMESLGNMYVSSAEIFGQPEFGQPPGVKDIDTFAGSYYDPQTQTTTPERIPGSTRITLDMAEQIKLGLLSRNVPKQMQGIRELANSSEYQDEMFGVSPAFWSEVAGKYHPDVVNEFKQEVEYRSVQQATRKEQNKQDLAFTLLQEHKGSPHAAMEAFIANGFPIEDAVRMADYLAFDTVDRDDRVQENLANQFDKSLGGTLMEDFERIKEQSPAAHAWVMSYYEPIRRAHTGDPDYKNLKDALDKAGITKADISRAFESAIDPNPGRGLFTSYLHPRKLGKIGGLVDNIKKRGYIAFGRYGRATGKPISGQR